MKLWKTLKTGGKTGSELKAASFASSNQTVDTFELEDMNQRRSSDSPDSGLPGERLARRALIHLDRRRGGDLGLILAGRSEPGLLPAIAGFKKESSAQDADRFAPGDRICSINGIATARLSNEEVLALLDNVEERASLEVEYYLPNYDSQSSLCITSRVAVVPVEREGGSLGVTLRAAGGGGGSAVGCGGQGPSGGTRPGALLVTHVRPNGPAYRTHRIKPGDRLLKVDNISLANKSLAEAYQILQTCPPITNLTVEYDISIMESVKFATGPLLIEIERGCNEDLGLILTDKSYNEECFGASANYQSADGHPGTFVESILPASISDRCGALHPGDQILAVDDLTVDNASYTPEEVMCYMENCSGKGFTQLQILPVHMLLKNYRMGKTRGMQQPGSPVSGMSTLNSRKSHRQNRQLRQSSVPKTFEMDPDYLHNNFVTGVGVCRSEILSLQLEIPPNHDSGITVCEDRELLLISHITHQSPAYRSGCLQLGDRIICINSQQNLTANAANDVLQKRNDTNCIRYLNIKAEFSMADSVEASSGVFNVKLAKSGAGLGVTITGNKQRGPNAEEPMIISNIKVGSVAYRSGTLAVGDQLIAIDSQPLNNLSLDAAFNILQNFPDDIIMLTVRKMDPGSDWRDVRNNLMKPPNFGYGMLESASSVGSSIKSGSTYGRVQHNNQLANSDISGNNNTDDCNIEREANCEESVFDMELVKQNDGPLGLTIAGSEDATQPIVLSGLVKGGLAEKSGALKIGDHILSINGQSVHQKPLSEAINMLQNSNHRVLLKVLRKGQYGGAASKISVPVKVEKGPYSSNRDSNTFTNNSQSSPGLASIDSAVESWDSQPPASSVTRDNNMSPGKDESADLADGQFKGNNENRMSYLPTDENKLLASGYRIQEHTPNDSNDLPMPNYSFTNTLRTFKNDKSPFASESNRFKLNDNFNQNYEGTNQLAANHNYSNGNDTYCDDPHNMFNKPDSSGGSFKDPSPFNLNPPQLRSTYKRNHDNNSDSGSSANNSAFGNMGDNGLRRNYDGQRTIGNFQLPTAYQLPGTSNYDSDFPGFYNMDALTSQGTIHHVTLYKDVIYDDYGFSVSDGLYERGVYINRIRKGGPADIVGLLRPFDRILQVNGTRTVDFDCCLTVPLIASAGDRIELVLQRLKDSWGEDNNSNSLETSNVITKTI